MNRNTDKPELGVVGSSELAPENIALAQLKSDAIRHSHSSAQAEPSGWFIDEIAMHGHTDKGLKRDNNEDAFFFDASMGMAIVADGMGGYAGGEVASQIAVHTTTQALYRRWPELYEGDTLFDGEYSPESEMLKHAVTHSNEAIFNTARQQPQYRDMGTTLVAMVFYDDRFSAAHIGDSRIYRLRDKQLDLITVDHTFLQEQVNRGLYTAHEAKRAINRNLVTRALGVDASVDIDIYEDMAQPADIYLLCSDGLTDMIEDKEISLILQRYNDNLAEGVNALIKLANDNGGKDNITLVIVKLNKPFPAERTGWLKKIIDWFF